jgi:precorrin-6Y C5,15-methyltransferase (decarboxylating)
MSDLTRWLAIVGIGEDGLDGLTPAARRLITQAELLVGGHRHLGLVGDRPGEKLAWPSPMQEAFPAILARRGRPVTVLASGDPFLYGVGSVLARHVDPGEIVSIPAPSAFSLAASRLGWALQDTACLSLHGRAFERILPHLADRARLLVLSWDETTPARLAEFLKQRGLGRSRLVVLQVMGGARERIIDTIASTFGNPVVDTLNTVAIEVVADPGARLLPRSAGLPDEWFEHDGQITKREIRALSLAALAPKKGQRLWDVGAGSGSVGIEWMLADPSLQAIAIERSHKRIGRIAVNAAALGVPGLQIVEGEAPAALADLARPDAIFIGGGTSNPALVDACLAALPPDGRLVANAVTIEGQAELARRVSIHGGRLIQIQISNAEPVGRFTAWRPAMPVVQWSLEKP